MSICCSMKLFHRCKRRIGDPSFQWRWLSMLNEGFKFILSFEIEYRTSRTIKRDTNSKLDGFKCSKNIFLIPKPILRRGNSAAVIALFCPGFGGSDLNLGGSDRTSYSQLKATDFGSSGIFLGGSEFRIWPLPTLVFGVFIPLWPQRSFSLLAAPEQCPLSLSHHCIDSKPTPLQNPCLALNGRVIPCEIETKAPTPKFLSTWRNPSKLGGSITLGALLLDG